MGSLVVDCPSKARVEQARIPSSSRGGEMDWQPEKYRDRLKLMARRLSLDRRFKRFFDSSDLVNLTLLRAHRHREDCRAVEEAGRLRWLHGILENAARDKRDKRLAGKRNLNLEVSLNAALAESSACLGRFLADKAPSPEQEAQRHELLDAVARAIDGLHPDQREAILRHYLTGEPASVIAGQMGKTPKAVAMLLYRGLTELRKRLPREE
jgi:RNA polymerase sigma-70 factor (ECF subfamily)